MVEWFSAADRWPGGFVRTDCCVRNVSVVEAKCRVVEGAFFPDTYEVECADGCGCTVDRGHLRGVAGRRLWLNGPPVGDDEFAAYFGVL